MREVNHMDDTILTIFAIVVTGITALIMSFGIGYMFGSDD